MSATIVLLDKYKATKGLPSDNAAAVALGVHRATVSGWRQRGTQAEPHVLAAMAAAVGEDPGVWLALVESERARSEADRQVWRNVARKLGAAAAVAAVALFGVSAQGVEPGHLGTYAYYVKWTLATVTGALAAALGFAYGRALRRLP